MMTKQDFDIHRKGLSTAFTVSQRLWLTEAQNQLNVTLVSVWRKPFAQNNTKYDSLSTWEQMKI